MLKGLEYVCANHSGDILVVGWKVSNWRRVISIPHSLRLHLHQFTSEYFKNAQCLSQAFASIPVALVSHLPLAEWWCGVDHAPPRLWPLLLVARRKERRGKERLIQRFCWVFGWETRSSAADVRPYIIYKSSTFVILIIPGISFVPGSLVVRIDDSHIENSSLGSLVVRIVDSHIENSSPPAFDPPKRRILTGSHQKTHRPTISRIREIREIRVITKSWLWPNCGHFWVNRLGKTALLHRMSCFKRYMLPPWVSWTVAKDHISIKHFYLHCYALTDWRSEYATIDNCGHFG